KGEQPVRQDNSRNGMEDGPDPGRDDDENRAVDGCGVLPILPDQRIKGVRRKGVRGYEVRIRVMFRQDPPIHPVDVDISRIEEREKEREEESDDRQNESGLERHPTTLSLTQDDQETPD